MALSPEQRKLMLPIVTLVTSLILLAGAAWVTISQSGPGAPPPSAIGGPFALIDQDGRAVTEATFKGQATLIFFGYTHCPDVCPTTLFELTQLMKQLGPEAKIRALFVTVDPERDTPQLLKDYLSSFDKRISGLTGERAAIDAMLKTYRVYARKVPLEGEAYSMDHSSIIYLMDKEMRFVNAVPLQDEAKALREIQRWM
jgi:protein SCO1/2